MKYFCLSCSNYVYIFYINICIYDPKNVNNTKLYIVIIYIKPFLIVKLILSYLKESHYYHTNSYSQFYYYSLLQI